LCREEKDKPKSSKEGTLVHERICPFRKYEILSPAVRFAAAAALMLVLALASPAQITGPQSHEFLLKYAHFPPTEFVAAERGQTVAKILATKVETEVAAFGMLSFQMPAEYFVERLRGIEGFMRSRRIWISLLLCCAQHSVFFAFHILNRTYCPVDV